MYDTRMYSVHVLVHVLAVHSHLMTPTKLRKKPSATQTREHTTFGDLIIVNVRVNPE